MTDIDTPVPASPTIVRWVDEPPARSRKGRPGRYTPILNEVRSAGYTGKWAEIDTGLEGNKASNQMSQLKAKDENSDLEFSQTGGKIYVRFVGEQGAVQGETEAA